MAARVNQQKIADKLGISRSTVSRVLSGSPLISKNIAEQVIAAANDLGYVLNLNASNLAKGGSRFIGILGSNLNYELGAIRSAELARVVEDHNYIPLQTSTYSDMPVLLEQIRKMTELKAAGMFICGATDEFRRHPHEGIPPYIFVDTDYVNCDELPNQVIRNYHLAYERLFRHLVAAGHREIALLYGDNTTHPVCLIMAELGKKYFGNLAHTIKLQISGMELLLHYDDKIVTHAGAEFAAAFSALPHCGAVVASNDNLAMLAMSQIQRAGLRVPADVEIFGSGNTKAGQLCYPALSTLQHSYYDVAVHAWRMLERRIAGEETVPSTILNAKLLLRESTRKD